MAGGRGFLILPLALGALTAHPGLDSNAAEPLGDAANWSDEFGPRGLSFEDWECSNFPTGVTTVTATGDSVVVGGSFTHVDGLVAPGVAVWDGARWAGLGTVRPPLRRIRDVEVFRGRIVVGGSPDDGAPPCAIWNGANWEPLGSLPAPTDAAIIEDLYVHEGRLLAGGRIPSGPGAADLVLRWDGESWSSLLSTARSNDAVRTLAEVGGQLHAGGNFEIEGDSSTLVGIARWDGTGWTGIPGLTSASHVDAIASFEGRLIVGGSLDFPENEPYTRHWAAAWDGEGWEKLTEGHVIGFGGISARQFFIREDRLWALGNYWSDIGVAPMLVRWTGEGWVEERPAMGTCGASSREGGGSLSRLAPYRDGYVVVGSFLKVEDRLVGHVAHWAGDAWSPLGASDGGGLDGHVYAVLGDGDDLWVGGSFTQSAGGESLPRLARWSNGSWTTTPTRPNGPVFAFGRYAGHLVVAGRFDSVGAVPTSNLALFDGSDWTAFPEGPEGTIAEVADYRGDLIACGGFTYAAGAPVHNIARWDGSSWSRMQTGLLGDPRYEHASHLTAYRGELVAGGEFYSAGLGIVRSIAAWDGDSWHGLGTPPWPERNVAIRGLTVWNGLLVAAAIDWRTYESVLATWDGSSWSEIDLPEVHGIDALSSYRGFLVVAGEFSRRTGVRLWDGSTLYELGGDIGGDWVSTIEVWNDDLYLGGGFRYAGGHPSRNLAVYHGAELPLRSSSLQLSVAPNPWRDVGFIAFSLDRNAQTRLELYDVQGRRRRTLLDGPMTSGDHWVPWDGRDDTESRLPAGVYFLRLDSFGTRETTKLQILR